VNRTLRIAAAGVLLIGSDAAWRTDAIAQAEPIRHVSVRAGSATIRVTIVGRGEAIICIPSRGRGVEDFRELAGRLAEAGYQVILPQPRGIGGSTGPLENITYHDLAADVAATIKSVVSGPVVVVGHDFGNRIARTLAADHPELVKRLILLSAGGMVPRAAAIESLTTRLWETPLSRDDRMAVVRQTFFAPGNNPDVWEGGWHFNVARAQRAADGRTPLREWWAGGSAPILILQGVDDVIAVPENARRLAAEFPKRVTVIEIPQAGHALLPEQPEQIANAILAYLRR